MNINAFAAGTGTQNGEKGKLTDCGETFTTSTDCDPTSLSLYIVVIDVFVKYEPNHLMLHNHRFNDSRVLTAPKN